ncbi:cyclic nucleotide-binding protein [Candidatus Scalindua japonica]|uniref:Cyclic nucleotide-binding protein n=2 Tax=Candidatus Scalindua japonica TaxID=1284222 RepID=A0A286TWK4_9BACT|nr:cyclic nucleotide-binding protein [Candidatus Scalindua japonica]
MVSGDPDKDYYEEVKKIFGDDVLVTVCITSDNIFQEEILQSIENISDKIGNITLNIDDEDVEVVTRVISLTTVNKIVGREGYLDINQLIDYIPSGPDELEKIKKNALQNETFLNDIVSKDGKTAAINTYIQASPPGYLSYNHEIKNKIQEFIDIEAKRLKKQGVNAEIFQIGLPVIKVEVAEYIENDLRMFMPICITVSLIILWFSFRTISAVIIPLTTGMISVAWTLGIMSFVGYPINVISNALPVLLIVVGCTEDIHMLSEYYHQLKAGNEKHIAIRNMSIKCGLAIFLTSLTTTLGFSALICNKIVMIREFGICSAIGLICNFIVTILFVPTFLQWTRVPKSFTTVSKKKTSLIMGSISDFICRIVVHKRVFIIIGTAMVIILAVFGTFKVRPDADYTNFFKKNSSIRVKLDKLHNRISGGKSMLIVIDSGQEGGIAGPEIMTAIAEFQDYLNQRFDKTISVADYVKIMHREMNNGDKEFFKIPTSRELISQYLLLMDGDDLERVLDSAHSAACIIVRHNIIGSWQVNKELDAIKDMSKQLFPKYVQVKITGIDILNKKAGDYMSKGQIMGLGLGLVIIFFIISILFLSPWVGFLAMIPNMIPILLNFGIMGWFHIPLSPATSIVAIIALGIAVDDTIHFMVRFHKELKNTNNQDEAISRTLKKELLPIMSTSIALALGFCILISSNFVSNICFGYLAAIAMLVALVSDLFVTPGLLLATHLFSSRNVLKVKN